MDFFVMIDDWSSDAEFSTADVIAQEASYIISGFIKSFLCRCGSVPWRVIWKSGAKHLNFVGA
jgi:hypothetical protein